MTSTTAILASNGRITIATNILAYMTAGKAVMTLVSGRTGTRYTYRIKKSDSNGLWFVSVLTGSDNMNDYTYIGIITKSSTRGYSFQTTRGSKMGRDSAPCKAMSWLLGRINGNWSLDQCEIYHDSHCGRCRRPLTVPESVSTGLGPVCMEKKWTM